MLFGSGIACEHDEEIPEPFSYLIDLKVVPADSLCSVFNQQYTCSCAPRATCSQNVMPCFPVA